MEHCQNKSKEEDQRTMTIISKHDTKHEWERDDRKRCWIGFLVVRNTICVNDSLKSGGNVVSFEICWRVELVRFIDVFSVLVEVCCRELVQMVADPILDFKGSPNEPDVVLVASLHHV
jgi:hypothetical protein